MLVQIRYNSNDQSILSISPVKLFAGVTKKYLDEWVEFYNSHPINLDKQVSVCIIDISSLLRKGDSLNEVSNVTQFRPDTESGNPKI